MVAFHPARSLHVIAVLLGALPSLRYRDHGPQQLSTVTPADRGPVGTAILKALHY